MGVSSIGGRGGWSSVGPTIARLRPPTSNAPSAERKNPGQTAGTPPASSRPSEQASGAQAAPGRRELTEEERRAVQQLQSRDREVRQHEQAHVSTGGPYVRGGAQLQYVTGPDGKRYANGGEVQIDVGAEGTATATIQKMKVVERAAMAPANPSPADRAVYTAAVKTERAARQQSAEQDAQETVGAAGPAAQAQSSVAEGIVATGATQPEAPAGQPLAPSASSSAGVLSRQAAGSTSMKNRLAPGGDAFPQGAPATRRLDVRV